MSPRRTSIRAANAIDVVEAVYRLDGTETEWLGEILARARPDLDTGCGVYGFTGAEDVPNLPASPVFVEQDLDAGFAERLMELNREAPGAIFDLLRKRLVTCGGLVQFLGADSPIVVHFRGVLKPTGVKDGFSVFAQDAESSNITMAAPSRTVLTPAPRVRGIWSRVGLHVVSGLRLRRRLVADATVRDALLDPAGKVHDASDAVKDDASARGVLVRAVRAMEQARRVDVRTSPERALDLWQGLVGGEWSLVEQWESAGRRYVAAYRNRPEVRDPRALTPLERSMLKYLALGASNKDIFYTLGVSAGTVSAAVSQILKKLGVRRRVDLAVMVDPSRMERFDVPVDGVEIGVVAVDARPRGKARDALTPVEREVAGYVVQGFGNERIARTRGVSARTIANQLRAIYEKLGVANRSQLARAMTK